VEADFWRVFGVPLRSIWAATEDVGMTIPDTRTGPYVKVISQARAEVVRPDGRTADRGEVGELVTSSPTTTPGYWQGPVGHAPLPGGAFRTGDMVRELSPGLLQYVGRMKDLIIRGGSNVSPQEVEDVLRAHPGLMERLAGYKVPERITIVDAVPRNALTKIDRAAITTALTAPQPPPTTFATL
jgi:acyl-CoA synthetase (AMP-forming)/AMP-acid ligase II